MSDHARFSPSGASRWMRCPGSVGLEATLPDQSSSFADEGSSAHEIASRVLQARLDGDHTKVGDPRTHIGSKVTIGERTFVCDADMARHVETYADAVIIATRDPGYVREVEQRVHFGAHIGAPDEEAFGTVDFGAAHMEQGLICVDDFKFGMGVRVDAEQNEQMMLYALGYLNKYDLIGDFHTARLSIHQPRIDHYDSWEVSVEDLRAFALKAKRAVQVINGDGWGTDEYDSEHASETGPLVPSDKSCKFCKAKATCPALRAEVNQAVVVTSGVDDFADLTEAPSLSAVPADQLGAAMDKVGLLEEFCKAIRAEVERRLLSDEPVASPQGGYKIVQGKCGNRAWSSEEEVETLLKSMRFKGDLIYTYKLKGPAPIEKLLAKDSPTRWKKLAKLITQPDGRPSVAPMSDARPAITKADVALGFDDMTESEND